MRAESRSPTTTLSVPSFQRKINSTILLHLQWQKSNARAPRSGTEGTINQCEFPKPAHIPALSLPRPDNPADFPELQQRAGPTLTEKEEAEEEQIELERFHSSAQRGKAGGQLGGVVSFSSSAARGAQPPMLVLSGSCRPSVCPPVGPFGWFRSLCVSGYLQPAETNCLFLAASGSRDPQQCPYSEQIHSLALGIPGTRLPPAGSSHSERASE